MNDSPAARVTLSELLARQEIHDVLHRYARGIDRGDWDAVEGTYHPDARDDHGAYKGDVPGLLAWLAERFADVEDSSHFLGQSLVEFTGQGSALVETYFVSRRLVCLDPPGVDESARQCREVWGRYIDEFEQRAGRWAVSRRLVVVDARYLTPALDGQRRDDGFTMWGSRDGTDPVTTARAARSGRR